MTTPGITDKQNIELIKIFVSNVLFSYAGLMFLLASTASHFDQTEVMAGVAFIVVLGVINRINYKQAVKAFGGDE